MVCAWKWGCCENLGPGWGWPWKSLSGPFLSMCQIVSFNCYQLKHEDHFLLIFSTWHTVNDLQLCFLGLKHTRTYVLYQPAQGSTRHGRPRLHWEADRNEDELVEMPWSLAWTCGHVCWSMATTLCLKKCTNFETVQLKIIRINFAEIWQTF